MNREQGTIQEAGIRAVCVVAAAAALYGCGQSGQSPTRGNTVFEAQSQDAEMAEVVISTSRQPRPRG